MTVDYLRIAGVPTSQIKVLTGLQSPWQTYEYLTRVSQIPRGERLRSDSASRPDCIWGFPSYALAEALAAPTVKEKLAPLKQVLLEPIFADFYTPRAGQVFTGLEREANRIGYFDMVDHGQVRMVRRRQQGGYFTILTVEGPDGKPTRVAYRSQYVHLAVGYPGLKFLPDLQDYRTTHQDYSRVVNASCTESDGSSSFIAISSSTTLRSASTSFGSMSEDVTMSDSTSIASGRSESSTRA